MFHYFLVTWQLTLTFKIIEDSLTRSKYRRKISEGIDHLIFNLTNQSSTIAD